MTKTLVIVGCGSMGGAIIQGLLNKDCPYKIEIVTPHESSAQKFLSFPNVSWHATPEEIKSPIYIIVFCIKPNLLKTILPLYKDLVDNETAVISVAAGKTTGFYKQILGKEVIRAMPNLPVSINQGVIGLYADNGTRQKFGKTTEDLFDRLGFVTWILREDLMNAVTALSGSGPAYVYHMIECMAQAGEDLGLTKEQAYSMALQTVVGASLYAKDTAIPADILREMVTSPNGTTQAALNILMGDKVFCSMLKDAMIAARDRGVELSK